MKIFSWTAKNNEIDTIMTPIDSMRYYKSILRTGMLSMEPQTGHVKAWVGGCELQALPIRHGQTRQAPSRIHL